MFLCRPFFKKVILHWHAAGLAKWLETHVQTRSRAFTYRRMKDVDLSIVLSKVQPGRCRKTFAQEYPRGQQRHSRSLPEFCEGNFATAEDPFCRSQKIDQPGRTLPPQIWKTRAAIRKFSRFFISPIAPAKRVCSIHLKPSPKPIRNWPRAGPPCRFQLMVAGNFVNQEEKAEFSRILATPDGQKNIHYLGFISGAQKQNALRQADLFCFPTYYQNENQPVNLIEAMAFGLPILTTRWRSIPELFPPDYRLPGGHLLHPIRSRPRCWPVWREKPRRSFREIFLRTFHP